METALAVLMVLGIYLVAPAVIGLGIAGAYLAFAHRRVARAEQAKALAKVKAEELAHETAKI